MALHVVIDSKNEVALVVIDGESITVKKQRFLPHSEDEGLVFVRRRGLSGGWCGDGAVGIDLSHHSPIAVREGYCELILE